MKTNPDKQYNSAKTAKRLVRDLKPIAWGLVIASVVCVMSVLLSVQTPLVISDMTNMLYDFGETGLPIDMQQLLSLAVELAMLFIVSSVLSALMTVLMTNITSRYYTKGLRIRISDKIARLPVKFVDQTPNGEILSRMSNDVSNMSSTIYIIIETLVDGFVRIVMITYLMYKINWMLATAVIVLVPLSIVLSVVISSKSEKSWHDYRKVNGKLYSFIEEDYTGFDTVKAFNLENRQKDRCDEISTEYRQKLYSGFYLSGLIEPIITLTNNIAYVAVCIIGGLLAINNVVAVGDIIAVILYAKMFAGPLQSIANGMGSIQHTLACANRVYNLLDMDEMPTYSTGAEIVGNGNVTFTNVNFAYNSRKPLIRNLNLDVKAGQKVALVGPTGGGKTTIVNLLMRFYDIDSGTITIDGVDTMTVDPKVVREQFGMVLQDTWLFNGTIYDNIAYGNPSATFEQVIDAAKFAHIDNFIDMLPDGYNTVINEESTNISSGQKQLLTIARSYLANRKMLILDEATSNVDTRTEILIQNAMDKLLKDRTSFVIAHRLSTIVNADVILVIDNGQVVEQGTHNELMSLNGFYASIYNSQYDLLK